MDPIGLVRAPRQDAEACEAGKSQGSYTAWLETCLLIGPDVSESPVRTNTRQYMTGFSGGDLCLLQL